MLTKTYEVEDCIAYSTVFSDWGSSTPQFSPFTIPTDHQIEVKAKSNLNFQIAYSSTDNLWDYAQNIGFSNNTNLFVRTSGGGNNQYNSNLNLNTSSVYKIVKNGTNIKIYQDSTLKNDKTTVIQGSGEKNIRVYNDANNIEYIKVKPL